MEENDIVVSICCITYNQEKYIADAIESFLMQKTNFKFEILIHDDASTDHTAMIVREYAQKYPELIKTVLQSKNQYSQGIKMKSTYLYPKVQGRYIALNEGDDYWIDPYKLQKQVDYMEAHPECSLSVHAAHKVSADNTPLQGDIRPHVGNKIFDIDEVIMGGGGLFATNGMFYRTEFAFQEPDFLKNCPIGDYPLAIHLALMGTVYYMDECMSVYRSGVEGSWSSTMLGDNYIKKYKPFLEVIETMLLEVDAFSQYKYTGIIQQRIIDIEGDFLLKMYDVKTLKEDEKYRNFYQSLNKKKIMKLYLGAYYPWLFHLLRNTKRQLTRCKI